MRRYVLRTPDRQGEFLKKEYDNSKPGGVYNHFISSSRKKVEDYALENNIKGWIDTVKL